MYKNSNANIGVRSAAKEYTRNIWGRKRGHGNATTCVGKKYRRPQDSYVFLSTLQAKQQILMRLRFGFCCCKFKSSTAN